MTEQVRPAATRGAASPTAAIVALVAVTAVWGATFSMVKDAIARMPVMDFLAVRFAVATAVMLVLRPRTVLALGRAGWRHGGLLGLALGTGYVTQTFGLQHTPAAVSGFITGMFVVFTPLIAGLVLHRRVGGAAWAAVGLATIGLALLSLRGVSVGFGELLTLGCAVAFAVHIVGLGEWSQQHDPYALAVVQLGVVAGMSLAVTVPTGLTLPPDTAAWAAVALTAVAGTAVAFVVQTWAQSLLSATRAAVVMTMEPVFAFAYAVLIAGERLGAREVAGGALVLGAMYLVELGPRRGQDADVERLEV